MAERKQFGAGRRTASLLLGEVQNETIYDTIYYNEDAISLRKVQLLREEAAGMYRIGKIILCCLLFLLASASLFGEPALPRPQS